MTKVTRTTTTSNGEIMIEELPVTLKYGDKDDNGKGKKGKPTRKATAKS